MHPDHRKKAALAFPSGLLINEGEGPRWLGGCPGAGKVPRHFLSRAALPGPLEPQKLAEPTGGGDLPTSETDCKVGKGDEDLNSRRQGTVLSRFSTFLFLLTPS